ncbi:hypothetical protein RHGRI_031452 [Rhododendron griersonianum]|uniref:Uncharacterized protein n=1 Tax=Rhododendron griersonianum TaxID=479676 RepID=A0AAV6IAJ0_9ERIC|nr:hypothetical protein RHGRI_031452 [Rhododendron griersonianum]
MGGRLLLPPGFSLSTPISSPPPRTLLLFRFAAVPVSDRRAAVGGCCWTSPGCLTAVVAWWSSPFTRLGSPSLSSVRLPRFVFLPVFLSPVGLTAKEPSSEVVVQGGGGLISLAIRSSPMGRGSVQFSGGWFGGLTEHSERIWSNNRELRMFRRDPRREDRGTKRIRLHHRCFQASIIHRPRRHSTTTPLSLVVSGPLLFPIPASQPIRSLALVGQEEGLLESHRGRDTDAVGTE